MCCRSGRAAGVAIIGGTNTAVVCHTMVPHDTGIIDALSPPSAGSVSWQFLALVEHVHVLCLQSWPVTSHFQSNCCTMSQLLGFTRTMSLFHVAMQGHHQPNPICAPTTHTPSGGQGELLPWHLVVSCQDLSVTLRSTMVQLFQHMMHT